MSTIFVMCILTREQKGETVNSAWIRKEKGEKRAEVGTDQERMLELGW